MLRAAMLEYDSYINKIVSCLRCQIYLTAVNLTLSVFFIKVENQISTYNPEGYMVVYAVDDENSVVVAEQILSYLKSEDIIESQAVILVANKIDLVRSREISSAGKCTSRFGLVYYIRENPTNITVNKFLSFYSW